MRTSFWISTGLFLVMLLFLAFSSRKRRRLAPGDFNALAEEADSRYRARYGVSDPDLQRVMKNARSRRA